MSQLALAPEAVIHFSQGSCLSLHCKFPYRDILPIETSFIKIRYVMCSMDFCVNQFPFLNTWEISLQIHLCGQFQQRNCGNLSGSKPATIGTNRKDSCSSSYFLVPLLILGKQVPDGFKTFTCWENQIYMNAISTFYCYFFCYMPLVCDLVYVIETYIVTEKTHVHMYKHIPTNTVYTYVSHICPTRSRCLIQEIYWRKGEVGIDSLCTVQV